MVRTFLPFLLLVLALAPGVRAAGMDLVVMVDTSASMFPYYDELVQYLLRDLLERWLHKGDTFHLLSFADRPELEIAGRVDEPEALARIIGRIYLLNPLGRYTDLVAALDYLYEYVSALPQQTSKLVLLLTDGIHDPPPESPNRGDAEQVRARLLSSAERIRFSGWDIHILQTPASASAGGSQQAHGASAAARLPPPAPAASEGLRPERASGGARLGRGGVPETGTTPSIAPSPLEPEQSLLQAFAERSGATLVPYEQTTREQMTEQLTGFVTLHFPGHLGQVGRRFIAVFTMDNPGPKDAVLKLTALRSGRMNLLARPVSVRVPAGQNTVLKVPLRLPLAFIPGEYQLSASAVFRDSETRVSPLEGKLAFTFHSPLLFGRIPLYVLLIIAAAAVVALALWLTVSLRNRMRDRSFRLIFGRAGGGRRPLTLRVLSQNPNIGTRNIHDVAPGSRRGVGGDGSAFLIFLRPMARNIGYVFNDGRQYLFLPKKRQYLPDVSEPIADCLNREIRALSLRGHEVRFWFQEYVSPLEQINRLMRSVKRPAVEALIARRQR